MQEPGLLFIGSAVTEGAVVCEQLISPNRSKRTRSSVSATAAAFLASSFPRSVTSMDRRKDKAYSPKAVAIRKQSSSSSGRMPLVHLGLCANAPIAEVLWPTMPFVEDGRPVHLQVTS